MGNVLTFIHNHCEFTWVKAFTLKLIRIKSLLSKSLSIFSFISFYLDQFFSIATSPIATKRNRRIRIDFSSFPLFTQINTPHVNGISE